MSDEKKPKSAGEIAADVLETIVSVAEPLTKSVGGTAGTVIGIVGGVMALGAMLARAFGSDAPVKLARMRSSIAERLKREKNVDEALLSLGVL